MSGASASCGSSSAASAASSGNGSASHGGSSGSASSSSQAGTYSATTSIASMTSAASSDLSQLSFSFRAGAKGDDLGSSQRGAEAFDALSRLSMPARPTLSQQDLAQAQDNSSAKESLRSRGQGLSIAMESQGATDGPVAGRASRAGAALAETSQQSVESQSSKERTPRAEGRREQSDVSARDIEGESFSTRLSHWRGDSQSESAEKVADKKVDQDPKARVDEEERVTQYYLRVVDSLVGSNMITEEMASLARGKRGGDLVAAVGTILSWAAERRELASRTRSMEIERQQRNAA